MISIQTRRPYPVSCFPLFEVHYRDARKPHHVYKVPIQYYGNGVMERPCLLGFGGQVLNSVDERDDRNKRSA